MDNNEKSTAPIALFDFVPRRCPQCGASLPFTNQGNREDYVLGATHVCACGLHYALASRFDMLLAQDDLARWCAA